MTLPQGPELILILAVLVLLFGAKKLPELGSSVGRTITNFKKGVSEGRLDDEAAEESSTARERTGAHEPSDQHAEAGAEERDTSAS